MSQKSIIVLYNEKESKIELNLEEITSYTILLNKILSFYKEPKTSSYHLMAINSSSPYTLLEEENYSKILNEKIVDDDLKLFLNKLNQDDISQNKSNNENKTIEDVVYNEADDEDFVIENDESNKDIIKPEEKKEENENVNNINIINNININEIDTQLKIDDESNKINNDDKQEENGDLFSQTEEMMKKIDQLMGNNNLLNLNNLNNFNSSNILDTRNEEMIKINEEVNNPNLINKINIIEQQKKKIKKAPLPFSRKNPNLNLNNNIINDDENEDIEIDENSLISKFIYPETFKSIKCTICDDHLLGIKYLCCVCDNCILCENCEKTHYHPCFKLKSEFLSNITDIYKFISNFYTFKNSSTKNFFSKIFTREYDVKIYPMGDSKICYRPKKSLIFPIKIVNSSSSLIKSSQFEIISKNNKLIKLLNPNKTFSLGANSTYILRLKCKTKNNVGKEKVDFYIFSDSITLKISAELNFTIDFEVNEDWEEEQLNLQFENNEYVNCYSKEHKQMVSEILNLIGSKNIEKEYIRNIFEIMVKCNWNKNIGLNQINKYKK